MVGVRVRVRVRCRVYGSLLMKAGISMFIEAKLGVSYVIG